MNLTQASKQFEKAVSLAESDDLIGASRIYRDLLEHFPGRPSVVINLTATLLRLEDLDSVSSLLPDLLPMKDSTEAMLNLGTYYFKLGDLNTAIEFFIKTLELDQSSTDALSSLAIAYAKSGKYKIAGEHALRAAEITQNPTDRGKAAYYFGSCCDWELEKKCFLGEVTYPFFEIARRTSEVDNQNAALNFVRSNRTHQSSVASIPPRDNDKPKIGYLSGEFREHATLKLMIELLENHNTEDFDFYFFDNGRIDSSRYRKRLEGINAKIVNISSIGDQECFDLLQRERIDVLINLNGFFGDHRNELFFRRVAPVQINYLGYPGTMGHNSIDIIVADPVVVPPENTEYYCEKVVYLDPCYQPNDWLERSSFVQRSTRRDFGLPEDSFIYCCLNNNYKITSEIFESWLQILERTDNSLLLLLADNDDAKQSLSDRASFRGLGNRLAFTDRLPTAEYLQLLGVCGVFLDTFPYNAHTTGADALHANLTHTYDRWSYIPKQGICLYDKTNRISRIRLGDV